MKKTLVLSLFILTISCKTNQNLETLWVNHTKVNCTGIVPMQCMQVHEGVRKPTGKWNNFYNEIEGFTFEEGYLYKLKIRKEKIENPPADGSSIKYILVKIVEKSKVNN